MEVSLLDASCRTRPTSRWNCNTNSGMRAPTPLRAQTMRPCCVKVSVIAYRQYPIRGADSLSDGQMEITSEKIRYTIAAGRSRGIEVGTVDQCCSDRCGGQRR